MEYTTAAPIASSWVAAVPAAQPQPQPHWATNDGITAHDIHLMAMALSMSGGAGLRATMPVFMLSLFHHLSPLDYPLFGPVSFLGEQEVCVVLGVLVLVEVLTDSIPALDHALHVFLTPAHAVMGAFVAIAPGYYGGWSTRVPMAVVGALLALALHAAKAGLRAATSGCSCGTLNPVVSICETALVVALVTISTLHPVLAALVIIGLLFLAYAGIQNARDAMYPDGKSPEGNFLEADAKQAFHTGQGNNQRADGPSGKGKGKGKGKNNQYQLAITDEETGPRALKDNNRANRWF